MKCSIYLCLEMRNQTPAGISEVQRGSADNIHRSASEYTHQSFRYQRVRSYYYQSPSVLYIANRKRYLRLTKVCTYVHIQIGYPLD